MDGITYTAVVSEERPYVVNLFETKVEIINGISSSPSTECRSIEVGMGLDTNGRLIDIKFLNDEVLLALWQPEGKSPHLIHIRFRQPISEQNITRLDFPEDLSSFAPLRIEAMKADNSRGGFPARVCLLGKDEVNYKVFTLPERR